MRLIDADRLLEERKLHPYYHLKNGDVAIPIIDIEHAPTVNQWIPCSERLPLHGSRVLVTATHKKLGHTAVDVLRYHGDEYGWENSDFCIVNAWMELPKAWEGEKDETTI